MKLFVCSVFVCVLLFILFSGTAKAWDGNRQGFIFGGGLGGGGAGMITSQGSGTYLGVVTSLKLGYAPSDHVMIHYWGQQIWLSGGYFLGTIAAPCLGITYYPSETSPSMFYTVGAGPTLLGAVGYHDTSVGTSIFLAVGRELQPHWSVELNIGYSALENEMGLVEFRVLVAVIGY